MIINVGNGRSIASKPAASTAKALAERVALLSHQVKVPF